ncbi:MULTISPECIES: HPP family protein [Calothrix]|uniref:HPP family protein n=2 Tax=Calothrix TaxID=1186 RepID=A0ABR8AFM2_9CYAN|nr:MULTISPECIES: HPP family protein [Calothrix]MBD2198845.1 HPP family protein [Calothrix parietina FACHB-288]MBD2227580.1 HPP family protein [Calothrix anomala FACHB-343]
MLPKERINYTYLPKFNYKTISSRCKNYCVKLCGTKRTVPLDRPHHKHIFWSWLGSFIGIAATGYLSAKTGSPLLMAPFGATSVLIFAVPDSPLAQPRNVIGGNLIGALVSLTILHLFGSEPWAMGMAVATAIGIMQFTHTLHPPSGAIALVVMMTKAQWQFLLTPALEGSVILLLCAVVFNNLAQERSYPKHWL